MVRGGLLVLVLAGALVAHSSVGPAVTVEWIAPGGCPAAEVVEQQIVDALPPDDVEASHIEARALQTEQGWSLSVAVTRTSDTATRQLDVDSCEAAAEAAPLVVGLVVAAQTPDSAPPRQNPPNAPQSPPVPADEDPTSTTPVRSKPIPAPVEPERERQPWSARAGISAGFGLGGLGPGASVVGRITAGLRRVQFGLRVGHAIRRQVRLTSLPDTGGNFSTLTAGPTASFAQPVGPVELLVSASLPIGAIRARGVGGSARTSEWVPWTTVAASAGLLWPLSKRVGLRAEVEAEAGLLQHTFVFDGRDLHTPGPVAGTLWIGPTVRFWP